MSAALDFLSRCHGQRRIVGNILSILIILINIMIMANEWLSSREAARRLGVSAATLYAYVSRGLLRSEAVDGRRERRYRADDIARLKRRRDVGRKAEIDRQSRARFRHAGARIGTHPDRGQPSLLSRPRCHGAGAHRLAGGDGPAPVGLRRQAVRRRQHPADDHGAAPGLAGRGHAGAGRSLPRAAAGGRRARPSELGGGPRRRCSRPASACCAC